jgi:ribosomal protein L37AE/L43A
MNKLISIKANGFKCPECEKSKIIKYDNNIICSKCGMVLNTPYPYLAGNKINVRYVKKPIKITSKGEPAYYRRTITEYKHNIPDYKIIMVNRKSKPILY